MKILIVAMFVSLVSVFAAVAHASSLAPGAYYVTGVGAGAVALMDTDGATHMQQVGRVVPDARVEGAIVLVMAPMVLTGHVSARDMGSDTGSAHMVHAAYRGEGKAYVSVSYGALVVGGEIGGDAFSIGGTVDSRCESVGPRLDGTFVTICDGLVMSVNDGKTVHMAPFGYAVNAQIGTVR